MHRDITVRDARESDLAALAAMDLHYPASRVLRLERESGGDGFRFALRWTEREAAPALYNTYTPQRLRDAMSRADAFFVADAASQPVGLLIVIVPGWTDAGEITDLAVEAGHRRQGAGRALVERALAFAHERRLRALWVEPRSDNAAAIEFYLSLGFRLSGFNDRMYSNGDHADGRVTLFMYRDVVA